MSTFEDVIDLAKFAAGLADAAYNDLDAADRDDPKTVAAAIRAAQCRLTHINAVLRQAVSGLCPHCAGEMDRYVDGREVTGRIALDEHGTHHRHVWGPDCSHPFNRQHDVSTITTHTGVRKRVIVSAPGFLDAVDGLRIFRVG